MPINKVQNDGPPQLDTIDLLTKPTKCSLLDGSECDMELALGTVYPNQQTCHTVPVQNGYAVVQPTYVWPNARHIKLSIPVEDEITTLADSLLQRIQWPRRRILIPPRSRDPNSAAPSAGNTASDAATLALRQQKQHQQDLQLDSQTLPQQHPLIQIEPQQHPLIQTEPQHKQLNQSPQQHSEHEPKNMEVGTIWTMLIQSTSLVSLCCQKRL